MPSKEEPEQHLVKWLLNCNCATFTELYKNAVFKGLQKRLYFPLTEVLKVECSLLEMKRWASDGIF